ncbi:MAG: DUF1800 domain-containing protein [Proteobacteria bacterium]|nr:DUF1800 domain-containing protein [Pseudomonadota bacterium]
MARIIKIVLILLAAAWVPQALVQAASHAPDPGFHDGFDGVDAGPTTDADAARFLTQATFGPTMASIAHLRAVGYQAWLNEQFAAPASSEVPYLSWVANLNCSGGNANCNSVTDDTRLQAWAINAVGAPDPSRGNQVPTDALRQRVAWALSQIFVVSNVNGTLAYEPWALGGFYDTLTRDAFGNYRTLLEDVTKHPAMGIFLSSIGNEKADPSHNRHPDENYAREVMQLFSIGLVKLNADGSVVLSAGQQVPTYSQNTVRGFAAVFTGWIWNNTGCGASTYTCCDANTYEWCGPSNADDPPWMQPMQPVEAFHDNTSDKQLLDYDNVALPGGMLAHGGAAQAEMTQALDNIFNHPNVGPFIARRLIQNLVTSNPSPGYIARVAGAFNGQNGGVRGDLRAVVRAILLDPEARYGQWQHADTFGKLREPLLKTTHLWRAMLGVSGNGRISNLSPWPPLEDWFGQAPLRAPSVFNFFTPDYQPSGEVQALGLRAPEFQILDDSHIVDIPNYLYHQVFCRYGDGSRCWIDPGDYPLLMNYSADATLAASNPGALLDKYNLLFLSGQMSPFMRQVLLTRMNAANGSSMGLDRVQNVLYLIMNSPEYSVQK